jgi:ketosteroid isomerase-like protein
MFAKRVWFVTSLTISLLVVVTSTTQADPKEEAREAIQRAYNRMDAALDNKDLDTHFSFYARDYIEMSTKGEQKSLGEARRETSRIFADPNFKHIKAITTIEKFTLDGDTATVFTKSMSTAIGVNPQTRAQSTIVSTARGRDTWVKRNGRWLATQHNGLGAEVTVDGRPVPTP